MFITQFKYDANVDDRHKTCFIVIDNGIRQSKHISKAGYTKEETIRIWSAHLTKFKLELIK